MATSAYEALTNQVLSKLTKDKTSLADAQRILDTKLKSSYKAGSTGQAQVDAFSQYVNSLTPKTPSLQDRVADFNNSFAQPSLITPSQPTNLSEGDKLALGLIDTSKPTTDQTNGIASNGLGEQNPTVRADSNGLAPSQSLLDAIQLENNAPKATGFLSDVVGKPGASFEVANGQVQPVGTYANQLSLQSAQSAADAVKTPIRAATTGLDIGKATIEDTLRTRIRRGIASTIANKGNLGAPLLEKPTLLG